MTAKNLSRLDVAELVEDYVKAASEHQRATMDGKYKVANRQYDVLARVYRELRDRGLASQYALLPLLDHGDLGVRAWAAAHALEFAPDRGVPVLMSLARSGGLIGRDAALTLEEWRAGKLHFP